MALASKLNLRLEATRTIALDGGTQKSLHAWEEALAWGTGTAASQADEVWSDKATVGSGAFTNLDLKALAQLDTGAVTLRTVDFAVIKGVFIRNLSASGSLKVGGGTGGASAADAWALAGGMFETDASIVSIPFGGGLFWYDPAGVAVTNSTADILALGGVSATQTYEIIIIGEAS